MANAGKPRNPHAVDPLMKKGSVHGKTKGGQRKEEKGEVYQEAEEYMLFGRWDSEIEEAMMEYHYGKDYD